VSGGGKGFRSASALYSMILFQNFEKKDFKRGKNEL